MNKYYVNLFERTSWAKFIFDAFACTEAPV